LRADRRHINDNDLRRLKKAVKVKFNLEMSVVPEIVDIAVKIKPDQATIVPEKRQELTTEGGLDIVRHYDKVSRVVNKLKENSIMVNLFIDPVKSQIKASRHIGADYIELHTGCYANAANITARKKELARIQDSALFAHSLGLGVNAGHGLDYKNSPSIAKIKVIEELNIGFSIVAASLFVGIGEAVKEMKRLIA
jgi:pyridoxine 5-phosphate synthase